MAEVIRLKAISRKCNIEKELDVKQKFIEACKNLDASVFEPLISEQDYFEDLDKYRFLEKLKNIVNTVKLKGVMETKLVMSTCTGCELGHQTHEFHSENGFEFSYLIMEKDGAVTDIFQCYASDGLCNKYRELGFDSPFDNSLDKAIFERMKENNPILKDLEDKFDLGLE